MMFVKHPVFNDCRCALIKGFNYLAIVKVILMNIMCLKLDFQHINVYVNVWKTYSRMTSVYCRTTAYTCDLERLYISMDMSVNISDVHVCLSYSA